MKNINKTLTLIGSVASEAYQNLSTEDQTKLILGAAKKLDKEYKTHNVFKASRYLELDEDIYETYELHARHEDFVLAESITEYIDDVEYGIQYDESLYNYIHRALDRSIEGCEYVLKDYLDMVEKTNVFALRGQAAAVEFKKRAEELTRQAATKLDTMYEPQHTYKEGRDIEDGYQVLNADLDVTYSMYVSVDYTWDLLFDVIEDEIDDDETLGSFIEEYLDARIGMLPNTPNLEYPESTDYQPWDFLPALCYNKFKHTEAMNKVLFGCQVDMNGQVEAMDGTLLDTYWGDIVVDGIKYSVQYYVPQQAYKKAEEEYGPDWDLSDLDWDSFQVDIYFSGFAN